MLMIAITRDIKEKHHSLIYCVAFHHCVEAGPDAITVIRERLCPALYWI